MHPAALTAAHASQAPLERTEHYYYYYYYYYYDIIIPILCKKFAAGPIVHHTCIHTLWGNDITEPQHSTTKEARAEDLK